MVVLRMLGPSIRRRAPRGLRLEYSYASYSYGGSSAGKILTGLFFAKMAKPSSLSATNRSQTREEGERNPQEQEAPHPKNASRSCFPKTGKHKHRSTAKREPEPRNEAQFADCAIFGDRRSFRNAEVALAFWGKTSGQDFFALRTALTAYRYGLNSHGLYSYGLCIYGLYS